MPTLTVVQEHWRRCLARHQPRGYYCQLIAGHNGQHFTPNTPHGQPPLTWGAA